MALTRTTHDEVRAVLGVSVEEIENSTLDLKVFTDQLEIELSDIGSTLPAQLDTIAEEAFCGGQHVLGLCLRSHLADFAGLVQPQDHHGRPGTD
jgi:hypothetical protein